MGSKILVWVEKKDSKLNSPELFTAYLLSYCMEKDHLRLRLQDHKWHTYECDVSC